MSTRHRIWIALLPLLAACADDPAEVEPSERSGFLGDYSQLTPGRGDEAQLRYIAPEADFSGYRKVIVDPVVAWEGGAGSAAPVAELKSLADALTAALREQLAHEFEVVEVPAAGTLRIRAALTGVHAGGASVELEVLDAASGERLVAVADDRSEEVERGATAPDTAGARKAIAFWAQRARDRLAAFRRFDAAEAAHEASLGAEER
jgi:hypothetical protein